MAEQNFDADEDDEQHSGCGYEWDHSLVETGRDDSCVVFVCRACGAEIIEDFDD